MHFVGKFRQLYSYGDSEEEDVVPAASLSSSSRRHPRDRESRLRRLRAELEQLEQEIAVPAETTDMETTVNVDTASLMASLTEVKGRLETLNTGASSSSTAKNQKLLSRVLKSATPASSTSNPTDSHVPLTNGANGSNSHAEPPTSTDADTFALLDRRLGELEATIGASDAPLDEVSLILS